MKHLFSLLLASACTLSAVAQSVPALVIGDGPKVALQDIVSIKFDAASLIVSCVDGSVIQQPLCALTFGTVDPLGIHAVTVPDATASQAYYDPMGRLSSSSTGFRVSRHGITLGEPCAVQSSSAYPGVATRAASATALQVQQQGIDPMIALSRVDSLAFSDDLSFLYLYSEGMGNAFVLDKVVGIDFPELSETVNIEYAGEAVEGVNPRYFDRVTITADGAHVVVNAVDMADEVEYVLSGQSDDGSFKVYSDYKWQATLQDLMLTNPAGPAINSQTGKKGTIKSPKGTVNTLCDGEHYASSKEDQKACVFSEGQLIFSGKGTLQVTSLNKHGICSDDYLSFDNGNVTVLTAASDAVHAKDSVIVQGCTLTLSPLSDGIDCDGPVFVRKGENGKPKIAITTTGDGAKGIKTGGDFVMTNGDVTIDQTGKSEVKDGDTNRVIGIRAAGDILISGGKVVINNTATGGKAMSAGGTIDTTGADVTTTP